jgi:hypothetical protein
VFKALRRYEEADFFVYLPDDALKKGLIAFAMTAKQADLTGEKDARNVVALLKEKSPTLINDERGSYFPVVRCGQRNGLLCEPLLCMPRHCALARHWSILILIEGLPWIKVQAARGVRPRMQVTPGCGNVS